ncbi:MAG TPA: metallophosphoesterase [bacterium]
MINSFFTSDLHGHPHRYEKLIAAIEHETPKAVFLGGDLLPHHLASPASRGIVDQDFIVDYLVPLFAELRGRLGEAYPAVFVILGNDDPGFEEEMMLAGEEAGLWNYVHNRCYELEGFPVYGYAFVPPTPFLLKDWERYDVSRYVEPGSVSPEEGIRTVAVSDTEKRYGTIWSDLAALAGESDLSRAVFLFHSPPHDTPLDRAALDGRKVDYVSMDVHVGSIAIRRFIEERQPLLTLHGHIHESARLTGSWRERIGTTLCFGGAHDGPELPLIRFDLENPEGATRELL